MTGHALIAAKVLELVVMGGRYPSSGDGRSWNFYGSGRPDRTAHVVNTWDGDVTFLGDDVGKHVLTGKVLMEEGPEGDPVGRAYRWYGYGAARASWDALAVWYGVYGLGEVFKVGNEGGGGWNWAEEDGRNRWVWGDKERKGRQRFLRLAVGNETAAEMVDGAFMKGAWGVVAGEGKGRGEGNVNNEKAREEL